jgi:hypothetical protein
MDILLDDITHDIKIGTDLQLVSGIDACKQRIKISLLFFYGEWFLDTTLGVDWFGTAFIKNPNQNFIDNMIIYTITDDRDIIQVTKYSTTMNKSNRTLNIYFEASTVYGENLVFNERLYII